MCSFPNARVLFFVSIVAATAASDACTGGDVILAPASAESRADYLPGLLATIGGTLPTKRPQSQLLASPERLDGCEGVSRDVVKVNGSLLVVSRGNCTYATKALQAQSAGAAALIVFNTEPGCLLIRGDEESTAQIRIPVVGVSRETGHKLVSRAQTGRSIVCWSPEPWTLDPAVALLWVLAVTTVGSAAVWAGRDHAAGRQCLSDGSSLQGGRNPTPEEDAVEVQMISGASAIGFVVVASALLVLLFFFLNHVFAILLTVLFSLASLQALTVLFAAGVGAVAPGLRARKLDLGWLAGRVAAHSLVAAGPAAAWVAAWLAVDADAWGWALQDGMGVALMLLVLRQFMVPDLKVASLLLPLCFLYDVFWVFIQPMLTSGPSVMVEVAQGGSRHETMPMLLRVPSLMGPPFGVSILGYGDVVLPGLLMVFGRIWDLALRKPAAGGYFWPLLAGYGSGLLITFGALYLRVGGGQGQPALLYLVPCTLGLCVALAWRRGELRAMWRGTDAELKRRRSAEAEADIEAADTGQADALLPENEAARPQ